MREIKFRAWHKEDKKMLKVTSLQFFPHKKYEKDFKSGNRLYNMHIMVLDENNDNDLYYALQSTLILMQFIGLKDKNGKEIYEGDIWTYQEPWEKEVTNTHSKDVVEYEDGCWNIAGCNLALVVIIGNIHENPELLEKNE